MSTEITVAFFTPPEQPEAFPGAKGGVRIVVDGTVLTAHVNDSHLAGWEPFYDARGDELAVRSADFTGESLSFLLDGLHTALVRFQTGDFDRFEEIPVEIVEPLENSAVVLSYVDGKRVRIAFQPLDEYADPSNYRDESMLGYVVDPDDLCRELIGCYREWMTFVDNAYPDHPGFPEEAIPEFHEKYEGKIAELEDLID